MARLFADEDFRLPVVEALRRLGHDVLTAQEAGQGNRGTPDDAILLLATSLRRVVVTHNRRHFIALQRRGYAHAGIIACTRDQDTAGLAGRIDQVLKEHDNLEGQLVRVVRPHRP